MCITLYLIYILCLFYVTHWAIILSFLHFLCLSTHLWFYARCQGLDDFMGRNRSWWFLILVTPAWWSWYYCSSRGWIQSLAVWVLVQGCVSRLCLVLPHHKPGQRQVLHWWDRNHIIYIDFTLCCTKMGRSDGQWSVIVGEFQKIFFCRWGFRCSLPPFWINCLIIIIIN